jgi:hypothetical protein
MKRSLFTSQNRPPRNNLLFGMTLKTKKVNYYTYFSNFPQELKKDINTIGKKIGVNPLKEDPLLEYFYLTYLLNLSNLSMDFLITSPQAKFVLSFHHSYVYFDPHFLGKMGSSQKGTGFYRMDKYTKKTWNQILL